MYTWVFLYEHILQSRIIVLLSPFLRHPTQKLLNFWNRMYCLNGYKNISDNSIAFKSFMRVLKLPKDPLFHCVRTSAAMRTPMIANRIPLYIGRQGLLTRSKTIRKNPTSKNYPSVSQ